jgi:hypothetical protein
LGDLHHKWVVGQENIHKKPDVFRIAFQNMDGFKLDQSDRKTSKISDLFQDYDLDALGVQEINLHLKILKTESNWQEKNHGCTTQSLCLWRYL